MAERRSGVAEALARLSEWADAHLGLLRSLSTGMAVAGVLVLARSVRMTTKFSKALDIPVEFVEKNVKLRGKLHRVTEKGLEVEHIPISIPFITAIQRKWQSKGLLLVRLAGVELAPSGMAWLQQELKPQQMIWFQLLGREDLALECLVLVNKGRFLSMCLNEEILRQGLGRTAHIKGLHHDSRLYWKLHKRLLRAELKASSSREVHFFTPGRSLTTGTLYVSDTGAVQVPTIVFLQLSSVRAGEQPLKVIIDFAGGAKVSLRVRLTAAAPPGSGALCVGQRETLPEHC